MAQPIGPYSTATDMLVALRAREISSSELIEMHLTRIAALDGPLNSIPVRTADHARDAAKRADALIARDARAPLLGLPMTVKESTQVAGLPQTAGVEELKNHRPTSDGPVPRSVFAAGACLLGKTNIPYAVAYAVHRRQDGAVFDELDVSGVGYAHWPAFDCFSGGPQSGGLPLGLQAIGPYLEDRTTLRFAQLLEREWQGFVPPPGY